MACARAEHGKVSDQVGDLTRRVKALGTAVASPRTFCVTGAEAPEREFDSGTTTVAQIAATSCCGTGLAYHFSHDAPINIGAANINATAPSDDVGMNGMVEALVSDLQSYFKFAAEDHARIGRAMMSEQAFVEEEVVVA